MSQFFASGGQNIGVSASVLPINIQDWFPLGLSDLISLLPKRFSRVFFSIVISKLSILQRSAFFMYQHSHLYMTTGKNIALSIWTFLGTVMSLLSNTLSRFVIAFLPRSKHLLIPWLQSLLVVVLDSKKIYFVTVSTFSLFPMKLWDWMLWSLFFECWVLIQPFHFSAFICYIVLGIHSVGVTKYMDREI